MLCWGSRVGQGHQFSLLPVPSLWQKRSFVPLIAKEKPLNRMGQFDFSREHQGRTSNKAPFLDIQLLHTGVVMLLNKSSVQSILTAAKASSAQYPTTACVYDCQQNQVIPQPLSVMSSQRWNRNQGFGKAYSRRDRPFKGGELGIASF